MYNFEWHVQPYAFDIKEKVVSYLKNDTDELAHSVSFLWKLSRSLHDDEEVEPMSVDMLVKFNQNLLSQCGLLYKKKPIKKHEHCIVRYRFPGQHGWAVN
jgi:hypothetical protein